MPQNHRLPQLGAQRLVCDHLTTVDQGDIVTGLPTPQHPSENVVRGILLALIVIPVGVAAWVAIWSVGVVASIVAYGIAFAAVWLYRRGSGGLITRSGAWGITAIVVVTLLLGFWLGIAVDFAGGFGHLDLLVDPRFQQIFQDNFGEIVKANLVSLLLAVAIGGLGVYRVLRHAFVVGRANSTIAAGVTPPTPASPNLNPESTGTISSAPDDRMPPANPRD
jgi:hypothetical protein